MNESCVNCHTETDVDVATHVDLRYYYVEGSGQLCRQCWEEVYGK